MKWLLTFLSILVFELVGFAQNARQWDHILIKDYYWGWSSFENEYLIKNDSILNLSLASNPDSVIKEINRSVIDTLLLIKTPENWRNDYLIFFGRSKEWLNDNAERLWLNYNTKRKLDSEFDSIAISKLKDYDQIKRAIYSIQRTSWTDDYPTIAVEYISGNDTTAIWTDGQYPYMLPWHSGSENIYNSYISTLVGEILPDHRPSNKDRILGKNFEHLLVDKIFSFYLSRDYDTYEVKKKYPTKINSLEKRFKVEYASLSHMTSIEWGGWFGANCLELTLSSDQLPENIDYSVVMGRRLILHSLAPLKLLEKRIRPSLESNEIYTYLLENKEAKGEIHFVNNKSLSGQAKREFLRDVKENGTSKWKYRFKLRKAIFFEMRDKNGDKGSFSRWLFLKNGSYILWEFNGSYLMGLPEHIINETGYICKEVSFD